MILREQVPLAPLTTLGVGGPARYLVEINSPTGIESQHAAVEAIEFARSQKLPVFVLGGGSNVVVADAGFSGLVIKMSSASIDSGESSEARMIYQVGAGHDWDSFVARTVQDNCAGLECLSGIPGTVGGTPVQNVGAYGQEVSETIRGVCTTNLETGRTEMFSSEGLRFGYRSSIFNEENRGKYLIVWVRFELQRAAAPALRYPELRSHFASRKETPILSEVRMAVLEIRRRKSMVIDPEDENRRSAGSFFKNPLVSAKAFEELDGRMRSRGLALPSYPAGEGQRKVPAAWLVEHAGFHKGYTRGPAGISSKHTLAIVNRGTATAAEIVALKNEIQARVLAEFGIKLIPEPVFLGF